MAKRTCPIGEDYIEGDFPNAIGRTGVSIGRHASQNVIQVAGWQGKEHEIELSIAAAVSQSHSREPQSLFAFCIAPCTFLLVGEADDLLARARGLVGGDLGTVTDLSHAKLGLSVEGPDAEALLQRLLPVDLSLRGLREGAGLSTAYHDILVQVYRGGASSFQLLVMRSFARSFWQQVVQAARPFGYRVECPHHP